MCLHLEHIQPKYLFVRSFCSLQPGFVYRHLGMSSQNPSEVAVCLRLLSGLRKIREKWENRELDPGLSFLGLCALPFPSCSYQRGDFELGAGD